MKYSSVAHLLSLAGEISTEGEISRPSRSNELLQALTRWFVLIGAAVCGATFLGFAIYGIVYKEWVEEVAKEHFAATIGLPLAALAAFLLVITLEVHHGKVEMRGFGFEFRGAAGPIVMWIMAFLAIAAAIRLLW